MNNLFCSKCERIYNDDDPDSVILPMTVLNGSMICIDCFDKIVGETKK